MKGRLTGAWACWTRFWFEPQATSTLAVFRIAFGVVATVWTATLIPNLLAFFGPAGILPEPPGGGAGGWGILDIWNTSAAVIGVFAATLAAAVALTLGLFTRFAAVVLWIGVMSLEHRNGLVGNSGDGLVRNLAFFCALAPCGAALSVDRLRKAPDRFWEFPARAPWPLRLIQIQLSIGYLSAVWHKSGNDLWRDGSAVSYALRMQDIHRAPTPEFITHSAPIAELLTFGTLAAELGIAVLVWNRAARPWVLALGVSLHMMIDLNIMVGFFSYAIFAAYLSFVPPDTAAARVLATRDMLVRTASRLNRAIRDETIARPAAQGTIEAMTTNRVADGAGPDLALVPSVRKTPPTGVQLR